MALVTQGSFNLFYEEPEADRWLPFDRFPRRVIRRLWRGPWQPSGHMRVFLNLMSGLDRIGAPYRVNDYRHMRSNQEELACLIGKPHVLASIPARVPLLFGPSIYNHPVDDEHLPRHHAIRQVLVPSLWVQKMFEQIWPGLVTAWPVGIDIDRWKPSAAASKDIDVLVYDKIFRERESFHPSILDPLLEELRRRRLSVVQLRYGTYFEHQLLALTRRARSMVYLSRHETQGIALQQTLASGVPVLAYDPGGEWQNREYRERGVRFGPVTSVPYWDDRCGVRFVGTDDLLERLATFWLGVRTDTFAPRQMILDRKLTLEDSARAYCDLAAKYSC